LLQIKISHVKKYDSGILGHYSVTRHEQTHEISVIHEDFIDDADDLSDEANEPFRSRFEADLCTGTLPCATTIVSPYGKMQSKIYSLSLYLAAILKQRQTLIHSERQSGVITELGVDIIIGMDTVCGIRSRQWQTDAC